MGWYLIASFSTTTSIFFVNGGRGRERREKGGGREREGEVRHTGREGEGERGEKKREGERVREREERKRGKDERGQRDDIMQVGSSYNSITSIL